MQLQLRLLVFFSFIHESPKGIFYRPTFSQLVILCAAVVFTSWLILVGLCCLLPLILISRIPNGTLSRAREPDTIAIHQGIRVAEEVNGTCVPFQNSAAWLQERLGNKASELTDENIYNLIELSSQPMSEKAFQTATSQTVCPSDSTFRKRIDPNENTWTFRLIYMAIHDLLHEPAMEEMRARRGCGFDNNNVGRFDYECPKTKFLVSFLHSGEAGLGALLRLQAVSIVLYALSLGRIPVFVNNPKDDGMQSIYWQIADIRRENHFNKSVGLMDCERGDLQCFFLPLSPCTITMEELRKAPVLSSDGNVLFDLRSSDLDEERIIVVPDFPIVGWQEKTPEMARVARRRRHVLFVKASEMIDKLNVTEVPFGQKRLDVLHRAANQILERYNRDRESSWIPDAYHNRYNKMTHAALLYLMRPRLSHNQKSDDIVKGLIPANFHENRRAAGLLIRGSGKCGGESQCIPFDTYMEKGGEHE